MKTVNLKYVSLLLLGCGLLMACVSPSLRITHAPTDPSQIPGSDTVATTVTPIRNSSPATISSTQILLPVQTITLSDENKSTPRPFISPPPTLALEFQKEFFDLLKTNGGCELPCFLGVIPGKSSWSQASERLKKFTHQNSFLPNWYFYPDGTAAPRSPEEFYAEISTTKDVSLNVHIIFAVESDHVKKITFDTITLFDRNGTHFSRYSLFEIFRQLGPPSYIYFNSRGRYYDIEIGYQDLLLAVEYVGSATRYDDAGHTFCPNIGDGDISSITITLLDPKETVDIRKIIFPGYPESAQSKIYAVENFIENSMHLSINEFYRTILHDQPACFWLKNDD